VRQYIGAPMHPVPLLLAHRSTLHDHNTSVRKGYTPRFFNIMYSFTSPIGGPNISVRLAYFHPNRLFTVLYKQETEYVEEKTTATLKSKQTSSPQSESIFEQPPFHYPLPLSDFFYFLYRA
jgi:hypothetical protein